jgi:two-component system chemotaxis response regulator CheB
LFWMRDGDDNPKCSPFTCPTCGGLLPEPLAQGSPFVCRNGHAFTDDELIRGVAGRANAAMWRAVRALHEHAALCLRIREHARTQGRKHTVAMLTQKAMDAERRAKVFKELIHAQT